MGLWGVQHNLGVQWRMDGCATQLECATGLRVCNGGWTCNGTLGVQHNWGVQWRLDVQHNQDVQQDFGVCNRTQCAMEAGCATGLGVQCTLDVQWDFGCATQLGRATLGCAKG